MNCLYLMPVLMLVCLDFLSTLTAGVPLISDAHDSCSAAPNRYEDNSKRTQEEPLLEPLREAPNRPFAVCKQVHTVSPVTLRFEKLSNRLGPNERVTIADSMAGAPIFRVLAQLPTCESRPKKGSWQIILKLDG
ncbi:hypothetical protein BJX99DRAFT_173848 [Aspergillus californicus]